MNNKNTYSYKKFFASESVSPGHPDKICDQISDAILDSCLSQDPNSRVACEVMAANRLIMIGGEITTKAYVDIVKCAWNVLLPLGYNESDFTIISNVNSQSIDINEAVTKKKSDLIGSGDQGTVFGYATNETPNYMPLPISIARDLIFLADDLRKNKKFKYAKTDMKSEVIIDYSDTNNLILDTVVMSIQHDEEFNKEEFEKFIIDNIISVVINKYKLQLNCKKIINSSGRFTIGGPIGDTGLTGRKIIVDTYGGVARHGGGAFSGKDATKVDRLGAYAARYIAKNIVASGLCDKFEIQLIYVIGQTKPLCYSFETFNTHKVDWNILATIIDNEFNLDNKYLIDKFKMKDPIFLNFSVYGHFGRNIKEAKWEELDKVNDLKKYLNK